MTNEVHESIERDLTRAGHTDPDTVQTALDAHDLGINVRGILDDIKAGLPQWLALLKALSDAGLLSAKKPAPKAARAKKAVEP